MARVLVVDDDFNFQNVLREILSNEGHEIQVASDAEEAMALIKTQDFDVAVIDIILPGISGMDLLEAIHKDSSSVQVIIMTGAPTIETAASAVRARPRAAHSAESSRRAGVALRAQRKDTVLHRL